MYLITGGERSGKSGFAEKIAKENGRSKSNMLEILIKKEYESQIKNKTKEK